MSKQETLEEYLKRGGIITKCPPAPLPDEVTNNRASPTVNGSATMMSLAEGALYYAESRAKPKERKKIEKTINFAALPTSLLKYIPKRDD